MKGDALTKKKLNGLEPLIHELFIGKNFDNPVIPLNILISLGDNIIYFLSLLICNQYLKKKHKEISSALEGYLTDLLTDRGLNMGIANSILHEISSVDTNKELVMDIETMKRNIEQWVLLKKTIRGKKFKVLGNQYRNFIFSIVENLFINARVFSDAHIIKEENFLFNNNILALSPFFVLHNCPHPDCSPTSQRHLFAFDTYSNEFNKYLYKCWGNGHSLVIDSGSSDIFLKIQTLENYNSERSVQYSSYLPLFESSFSSLKNMVQLLFEQTQKQTQKKLWQSFEAPYETHKDQFVKNKILLDCIERGPVAVIRDVALMEGVEELPGYVKKILSDNLKSEKEIQEVIMELERKCNKIARERYGLPGLTLFSMDHHDPEFIKIRNEVYSLKVIELLNFKIEEMDNVSHLEYNCYKIKKAIEFYSQPEYESESFPNLQVAKKVFYELELVYKEIVCFYQFILDAKIKKTSKTKSKIDSIDAFFSLHFQLIELQKEFSGKYEKECEELFGKRKDSNMKTGIFDLAKYEAILRIDDERGSLLDLKMALSDNENKKNRYLQDDSRKTFLEILAWIKEVYEFFLDTKVRVYPYKILFTVSSEIRPFSDSDKTMHGIKTCQYVTYIGGVNSEEKKTMKIYTDQEINFSAYYYCIPHQNRSLDNIWVDPVLISINDVGFVADNQQSQINKVDEYDQNKPFIFISYAHSDIEKIKPDLEFLTNKGYRFFLDKDIPRGSNWDNYLGNRINGCAQFIVFLSVNSTHVKSFVLNEIGRANDEEKNIIPIFLENVTPPLQIHKNQGIKKFQFKDNNEYWNALINGLGDECLKK